MANLSSLGTLLQDLFDVIGILITEIVELMTGDLLVLAVVGAVVSFIIGLIYLFFRYIKSHMTGAIKMRKP